MSIRDKVVSALDLLHQTLLVFPHSALTIPRQRACNAPVPLLVKDTPTFASKGGAAADDMISDKTYGLCHSTETLSSLLAKDPTLKPGDAWEELYGAPAHGLSHEQGGVRVHHDDSDLQRAAECGKWGAERPSELFLKMYQDALSTLDENPSFGTVSPPLMGTSGVVPLTIISVIPDIMRHLSNLVARSETEVFMCSSLWENSVASKFLTEAIRELDRRAGQRGTRVVVKLVYNRASVKLALDPHHLVSESDYTGHAVGLPAPAEIPNIDLQVMNYHLPILGTMHAKFMIVDRRIATVHSNNTMDNDNVEMMVQLEGPVVDSLYDMALFSWHKLLDPPMPNIGKPAAEEEIGCWTERHEQILGPNGAINGYSAVIHPDHLPDRPAYGEQGLRADSPARVASHSQNGQATAYGGQKTSREPGGHGPGLPEHTADAPHYDADLAGEVARIQASLRPAAAAGETQMQAVARRLNHTVNAGYRPRAPECAAVDEMTPYLPHPRHGPVPMALVCREPYGRPDHRGARNPQDAAWLSALRRAARSVFIQTPTLNADAVVAAIAAACERGVDVYCYVCLGYNDSSELLPMQGGHNEFVAHQLHARLSPAARARLHYFWYVAKDQTAPLAEGAAGPGPGPGRRRRSCHAKLMIVDECVGIVGSGNQDTQSWYHSQEVNVMIDSAAVCRVWIEGLRRNQNTALYGRLDPDGVWRDARGREAEGAYGVETGRFSWLSGVMGLLRRGRGSGRL